jgi:hypothetical protein
MIAKRVAGYVSAFTLYSSVRPFGLSTILGVVDAQGPAIFMVEPSGLYYVCIDQLLVHLTFIYLMNLFHNFWPNHKHYINYRLKPNR